MIALLLAGCSGATSTQRALPLTESASAPGAPQRSATSSLSELYNLDYSHGAITAFSISGKQATATTTFKPGHGLAQGLASDARGRIYTTVTNPKAKKCAACVEVFSSAGKLVKRLEAPILSGAAGAPSLTDVSVDAHDNAYVSDYGQQAVYFFPHGRITKGGPTIVVQNSTNAASVAATPDGTNVFVSGGCGFASVRPYTRVSDGQYTPGKLLRYRHDCIDRRRSRRSGGYHYAGRRCARTRLGFITQRRILVHRTRPAWFDRRDCPERRRIGRVRSGRAQGGRLRLRTPGERMAFGPTQTAGDV